MLLDQFQKDLTEYLKQKDAQKVGIVRLLMAEIRNKQIELRGEGKELDDSECLKTLAKEAKKRKEAIEIYSKAGKDRLVESEKAELEFIEQYLPKQMSKDEIKGVVNEVINSADRSSINFGIIMQRVMAKIRGKAEGKIVAEVVKEILDN